MVDIIIKNKIDGFGKTRSVQEENIRRDGGRTMTDEELDKLKYLERKHKEKTGSNKNFITGIDINKVK